MAMVGMTTCAARASLFGRLCNHDESPRDRRGPHVPHGDIRPFRHLLEHNASLRRAKDGRAIRCPIQAKSDANETA